jgi:hypothetical protein
MVKNPFYYGGAVKDNHFCNRIDEIKELSDDINAGLNILIYAPRRFGKTSFVLKTLEKLEKDEDIKYIFLDIFHISTIDEFINLYFNAIAKSLEKPTDEVIKFFKSIINIRPNINVNFDSIGNPSFSLALNGESRIQTLEDVLNIPLHLAKDKKIVIVFDEFQQIATLDIEAKLRSIIQLHSNKISYIFMGSKKSILHNMFLDKNRPFYKSVKHFKIQKIQQNVWSEFITSNFTKTDKTIDIKYINKIIDITKGFPYYTQQFAYELWIKTNQKVDDDIFKDTLKTIIEREDDLFSIEWDNLTLNQQKALKIIINKNGKNLYDEEYLVQYKLKVGSFQTALKGLVAKDIVDKVKNIYYLQDPLFEYWLKM